MPSNSTDLLVLDGRAPWILQATHLVDCFLLAPVHADKAGVVAPKHASHVGFRNRWLVLAGDVIDQCEFRQERVRKLEAGIVGGPTDPVPGTTNLTSSLQELVRLAPAHGAVEEADIHPNIAMPRAENQALIDPRKACV